MLAGSAGMVSMPARKPRYERPRSFAGCAIHCSTTEIDGQHERPPGGLGVSFQQRRGGQTLCRVAPEHEQAGSGAGHDRGQAVLSEQTDEHVGLGHRARAVRLVQTVLGRGEQQLRALDQRGDEQRRARHVERGVGVRHAVGLQRPRELRRQRRGRHEDHRRDTAVHQQALVRGTVGRHPRDRQAAEQRGCDVVRMPLHLGGERQQGRGVEVDDALEQPARSHQPGDDRRGGRPQTAAVRDGVDRAELEPRLLGAGVLETTTDRTHDQVRVVGRDLARADPLHGDRRAGCGRTRTSTSS